MNKREQLVLMMLKPKSKALGFNKKELQGVAAIIADNLVSAEDASEEEVKEEIEKSIDNVIPFLSFGQSQANRLLEEWKKSHPTRTDDDDDDDEQPTPNVKPGQKNNNPQETDNTPGWAKGMMQTIELLTNKLSAMEGEKLANTRKGKLEALLKDSGTFGTRTLKSFGRMKFDSDDEFDEFYSDVEADLKAYQQERADAGLQTLGTPPGTGKGVNDNEPFSDKEIEAMADNF